MLEEVLIDNYDLQKLKLSFLESAVLKTYITGYSENETQKFLEINKEAYTSIIDHLHLKYQTNNIFDIIYLTLINGQLDRYDLVKDEVKKIALNYSKYLFENFKSINFFQSKSSLKKNIFSHFDIDINKLFINNATHNDLIPLTLEETLFCKHTLTNYSLNNLIKPIEITDASKLIEKKIITKFNSNNYFNAIRRVFELNLIDKSEINTDYRLYYEKLQSSTSKRIGSIFFLDKYSDKEKQLCIYFDLVNYYNKVEDILLFGTYLR